MVISVWGLQVNNFGSCLREKILLLTTVLAGCPFNVPSGWRDGHVSAVHRTDRILTCTVSMTSIQRVFHKKREIQAAKGCASLPAFHLSLALFSVPEVSPLSNCMSREARGSEDQGREKRCSFFFVFSKETVRSLVMLLLFVWLPCILCQAVREVFEVKFPSSAYYILYSFYMYVSKPKFTHFWSHSVIER